MAKLKKTKSSSRKLSFGDLDLDPKPVFEIDNLSYKQRTRKSKKNVLSSDDNKSEKSDREARALTKSELKKSEKKRKSLHKSKNKSDSKSRDVESTELRTKKEQAMKTGTRVNSGFFSEGLKGSIKDGSEYREIKTNSFLSFEDSFKSISEFNNSSIETDSNESSSTDHEDFLCKVNEDENENTIATEFKGDTNETSHLNMQRNDTYEELFDEILNDKARKEEELSSSKKTEIRKETIEVDDGKKEYPIELYNSSQDDINLLAIKEENQDSAVQTQSKSETPSPKRFSKRKMLYSFANSVWDYVKPVSLDDLEKKQSELKKDSGGESHEAAQNSGKKEDNETDCVVNKVEYDDETVKEDTSDLRGTELSEKSVDIDENESKCENFVKKVRPEQAEIMERSKSQEVISNLNNYSQVDNGETSSSSIPIVSNSHNGSLITTPIRKSKRQMLYSFANSLWDYVKPVSLDELEGKKATGELKEENYINDDVSDSEFYIQDNEKEEEKEKEIQSEVEEEQILKPEENMELKEEQLDRGKSMDQIFNQTYEGEKEVGKEHILDPHIFTQMKEGEKDEVQDQVPVQDPQVRVVEENSGKESMEQYAETGHESQKYEEYEQIQAHVEVLGSQERVYEEKEVPTPGVKEDSEGFTLDRILHDIAVSSDLVMDELSRMDFLNVANDHNEGVMQIPDYLSEISSIQRVINSSRLEILQSQREHPSESFVSGADQEVPGLVHDHHQLDKGRMDHSDMNSCRGGGETVVQLPPESGEDDSAQQIIERMQEEILNTNLSVDEYDELFNSLHIHTVLGGADDYNMNVLGSNTNSVSAHHQDKEGSDGIAEHLGGGGLPEVHQESGDHYSLFKQIGLEEAEYLQFQSIISSGQLLAEEEEEEKAGDKSMSYSGREDKDSLGLREFVRALESCSGRDCCGSAESSGFESDLGRAGRSVKRTNKRKLFSKLYRLDSRISRKLADNQRRIRQLDQEIKKVSRVDAVGRVKKEVARFVSLVEIEPKSGGVTGNSKQLSIKEKEIVVREEILPSKQSNTKQVSEIAVNTEVMEKASSYQEKAVNTVQLSSSGDSRPTSPESSRETKSFVETNKKIDSIFRSEIYKILDDTRLLEKGQKLKSGYANTDTADSSSRSGHFRYKREKYAKPDDHRYDIVSHSDGPVQSSNPEGHAGLEVRDLSSLNSKARSNFFSNLNGLFQDKSVKRDGKNAQLLANNGGQECYRYRNDLNLISPRNYSNYYLRSDSPSPSYNYYSSTQVLASNNNNVINTSSYYYNGGNAPFNRYEYPIKPSNVCVADQLGGRSNYHVNYYCGVSGGPEEVKRYMYVDGFANKNHGSIFSPRIKPEVR